MTDRPPASRLHAVDYIPRREIGVAVVRMRDQQPTDPHGHDFLELVLILAGRGHHCIAAERLPLAAGDVFVVHRHHTHKYVQTQGLHLVNVILAPEAFARLEPELAALPGFHALFTLEPRYRERHRFESRLRLEAADLGRIEPWLRALEEELAVARPGARAAAHGWLLLLLTHLARCYGRSIGESGESPLGIARVLAYLEGHYSSRITTADLCRIAGMTPRTLQRAFREALDRAPVAHLLETRIRHAASLLAGTDRSATDIAYACGFTDPNYFSRQFRRHRGCPPTEFRRRAQN